MNKSRGTTVKVTSASFQSFTSKMITIPIKVTESATMVSTPLESASEIASTSVVNRAINRPMGFRWKYDTDRRLRCANTATRMSLSRSEEHTSELQSRGHLVCRHLLEKKNAH